MVFIKIPRLRAVEIRTTGTLRLARPLSSKLGSEFLLYGTRQSVYLALPCLQEFVILRQINSGRSFYLAMSRRVLPGGHGLAAQFRQTLPYFPPAPLPRRFSVLRRACQFPLHKNLFP